MKTTPLPSGITLYGNEYNGLRADAKLASVLLAHQQLGAIALGTNPSNTQTLTLVINGTNVILTGKTGALANPGDFSIGGTAAATVATILAALNNPTVTTSTFVALSAANAQLIQYVLWSLPLGGTTITASSLNTTVAAPLTSFTASTTITSGSYTANTMGLYVEPGVYYVGPTQVKFLGGSSPTVTAPSSHPRIDVLTINSSGTLAWTTGTENASPSVPTYPVGKVPICEIYNVVGETGLYDYENQQASQGYIQADVRPSAAVLSASYPATANGSGTVSGAGTQTIAHGLGRIPSVIHLFSVADQGDSNIAYGLSIGSGNGSTNACIQFRGSTGLGIQASYAALLASMTSAVTCLITCDATNIYLAWSLGGSGFFQVDYAWDAQ